MSIEYYRAMLENSNKDDEQLMGFIDMFIEVTEYRRVPLMKMNRWLGYIQGRLISLGLTNVEYERNWTRPLFRPLDFPDELS